MCFILCLFVSHVYFLYLLLFLENIYMYIFFFLQNRVLFCSPGWHWFRQAALECRVIFLSQPSECWSDKNEPPFLATCIYLHYWHYFLKMNICFTFMKWEACLLYACVHNHCYETCIVRWTHMSPKTCKSSSLFLKEDLKFLIFISNKSMPIFKTILSTNPQCQ